MTDRITDSLTSWGHTRPGGYAFTSLSSPRLFAGLALLFLLQACSQIPSKELDAYREAFTQASAASESILIDLDQAKKADIMVVANDGDRSIGELAEIVREHFRL